MRTICVYIAIKTPAKDRMTIGSSSSSKLMGNLSSKHKYCLSLIKNPKDKYLFLSVNSSTVLSYLNFTIY